MEDGTVDLAWHGGSVSRVVIFGNSGSGKSTRARSLGLPHLDLDTLAWEPGLPPTRRELAASTADIETFVAANPTWVIEGCYADLLDLVVPDATDVIFLDLSVEACVANARARPWEPHKYESREAQDANLDMLVDWIRQYPVRDDTFSRDAHEALFDRAAGRKHHMTQGDQRVALS